MRSNAPDRSRCTIVGEGLAVPTPMSAEEWIAKANATKAPPPLPKPAATCLEILVAVLRGQHVTREEVGRYFIAGLHGRVARVASFSALQAVRTLEHRGLAIPLTAAHAELLQRQRDIPILPFVATPAGVIYIDGIAANAKT